jgi:hypothetical protein
MLHSDVLHVKDLLLHHTAATAYTACASLLAGRHYSHRCPLVHCMPTVFLSSLCLTRACVFFLSAAAAAAAAVCRLAG